MTIAELSVLVRGDVQPLEAALGKAQSQIDGFTKEASSKAQKAAAELGAKCTAIAQSAGRAMTLGLTLPILAIGTAAIKASDDFETAMAKVEGAAGAGRAEVAALHDQVLDLAVASGKGPKDLADGLYFVESMGYRGAAAMDIMTRSAHLSAANMGTTADIAKTVTFAINAYGREHLTAAHATDVLAAAVRAGAMAPEAMAGAIGRVLPEAARMGVGFDKLAGSLAAMTRIGLNVDEAVTAIRQTLLTLDHPSKQTKEALESVGLSVQQVSAAMRTDFIGTLGALAKASEGSGEAFQRIFPNVRAFTGVLALTGQQSAEVKKILDDTTNSVDAANTVWGVAANTAGFKFRQSLQALTVAAISFGDVIAPVAQKVAETVTHMSQAFARLSPVARTVIAVSLAVVAAIGPLILGFVKLYGAMKAITEIRAAYVAAMAASAAASAAEGVAAGGAAVATTGLASAMAVLSGPVGWTIGAIAALAAGTAFLVSKYKEVATEGQKSTEQLSKEWHSHLAAVQASADHAQSVAKLYKQIEAYTQKSSLSSDEMHRMHLLMNDLADKSPDLVKAYDDNGNAVKIWTGRQADLNVKLAETARLARIANAVETFGDRSMAIRDQMNAARQRISELRHSGLAHEKQAWVRYDGKDAVSDWGAQSAAESHGAPHKIQSDYSLKATTYYEQSSNEFKQALRDSQKQWQDSHNGLVQIQKQFKEATSGVVPSGAKPLKKTAGGGGDGESSGEKETSAYETALKSLESEIASIGKTHEWETAIIKRKYGEYAKLTEAHWQHIYALASEKDRVEAHQKALEASAAVTKKGVDALVAAKNAHAELGLVTTQDKVSWELYGKTFAQVSDKAHQSIVKQVAATRDSTTATLAERDASAKLGQTFGGIVASRMADIAAMQGQTDAQRLQAEMDKGDLQNLTWWQKLYLAAIQAQVDKTKADVAAKVAAAELRSTYDGLIAARLQDIATMNGQTEAQRLQIEMTSGSLKNLSVWQKVYLAGLQAQIDKMKEAKTYQEQMAAFWKRIYDAVADAKQKMQDQLKEVADKVTDIFMNALDGLHKKGFSGFFKNILGGFNDMLREMGQAWLRSQIQRMLLAGISPKGTNTGAGKTSGSGGGGGGGTWTEAIPSMLSGIFSSFGHRAGGGPVMGGQSYLVGERGPELFTPTSSGSINNQPNQQHTAPVVHVHMTVNATDAASFRPAQSQIASGMGREILRHVRRNGQ